MRDVTADKHRDEQLRAWHNTELLCSSVVVLDLVHQRVSATA
jgi:hypothetical protein